MLNEKNLSNLKETYGEKLRGELKDAVTDILGKVNEGKIKRFNSLTEVLRNKLIELSQLNIYSVISNKEIKNTTRNFAESHYNCYLNKEGKVINEENAYIQAHWVVNDCQYPGEITYFEAFIGTTKFPVI